MGKRERQRRGRRKGREERDERRVGKEKVGVKWRERGVKERGGRESVS